MLESTEAVEEGVREGWRMRGVRGPIQEHSMTSYSLAFGVAFKRAAAVERNGRSRSIISFDEIPKPPHLVGNDLEI